MAVRADEEHRKKAIVGGTPEPERRPIGGVSNRRHRGTTGSARNQTYEKSAETGHRIPPRFAKRS
jgi:hypothetical protein